jgi:T3SS negative regulator,GrlR
VISDERRNACTLKDRAGTEYLQSPFYQSRGLHMQVRNGLYSIRIEMRDGKRGHATGVIILSDGRILGGDTYFYYTGSYSFRNGKWRGELITHQHTEAVGKILVFGGREVTCGFTGIYSDGEAEVEGTALVGKISVLFGAVLKLQAPL